MQNLIPVLLSAAHFPREEGDRTVLTAVRDTYLKKCSRYFLLPLIVSPDMSREMVERLYEMSAGVLLIGGADVDPAHYQETPHRETGGFEPARDALELELFRRARRDRKPILGICRGAQLIAVAAGGKLLQHVPDHTAEAHDRPYNGLFTDAKHDVVVEPGTRLHSILKSESGLVNSAHHQSVRELPVEYRVSLRSPDGIVEGFETTDPSWFCIGLQSHPEAEEDGFLEPVFAAFRDALDSEPAL